MSLTTARIRRRFYKDLPDIAFCSLMAILMLMIFILVTNRPLSTEKHRVVGQIHVAVSPVERGITPTPTLTDKEFIFSLPHGDLVWKIYGQESTWGKHDACKERGFYNGFGFGQNGNNYDCFSSLEEVATKVNDWISKNIDMGITSMLCYYNTGKQMNACGYAERVLSL